MKIVCIPDSQNMEHFQFGEFERLLTVSDFSLESLTFEDMLAPGDEEKMLEFWETRTQAASDTDLQLCEEIRVLSCREFCDTVMTKMPGLAAIGVLRVTSQMRDV